MRRILKGRIRVLQLVKAAKGFDPMAAPQATAPLRQQQGSDGGALGGAARGAAIGAVGGAIAGNAGKGTAI